MLIRRRKHPAKNKLSLSEKAYNHLVNKLLSRELSPGDIINRRQVATELRMSVAPVLEAMVQLQNDGFVESIQRKGTIVKSIRLEDLRGLVIVREALEVEAARFFCGPRITQDFDRLRQLAQKLEDACTQPEISWKLDFEFHRALVELAECPALLSIYDKVMMHKLFLGQNLLVSVHGGPSHHSHLQLLEELQTRNADKAGQSIRRHIRAGKTVLLNLPEE